MSTCEWIFIGWLTLLGLGLLFLGVATGDPKSPGKEDKAPRARGK